MLYRMQTINKTDIVGHTKIHVYIERKNKYIENMVFGAGDCTIGCSSIITIIVSALKLYGKKRKS
jgi:hypothetical protein